MFQKPILFLIFNRPDTTKIVFNKIKELKPKYLFVSADGPRSNRPEENDLCLNARNIINEIDWDCELKTNFSDINLGCKIGVSSGINWFFQNVEEGIILEDDCLPDISFFYFCESLLEKYRHDTRIMHIGGVNFQDGKIIDDGSYYFSKYVHIWGWATWKRAWDFYNVMIPSFNKFLELNSIKNISHDKREQKFLLKFFSLVYSNKKDTWDYQWHYTILINNGLTIVPNENLVTNIGFGKEATHTLQEYHPFSERPLGEMDTIIHPTFVIPNCKADRYSLKKYFNPNKLKKLKIWLYHFLKK